MKVLVTGWRGFLGSHLVEKLKKEGHDVILFKGDVRNYADCLKESKGCDLISHLAAISSGEEKTMKARSPIIPARISAGVPFGGPLLLESVLKRRLNSQNGIVSPAAVVT